MYTLEEAYNDKKLSMEEIVEIFQVVYGYIPYMYSSTEEYPFVIFDEKKNCIGADDTFLDTVTSFDNEGALNVAKGYMTANVFDGVSYGSNPRSAVILLRRDYQMHTGSPGLLSQPADTIISRRCRDLSSSILEDISLPLLRIEASSPSASSPGPARAIRRYSPRNSSL